jgi:PAS domain S-box-containing protein
MNQHGNTTKEFVREWQAGESPLHSFMPNQSRWNGADPALGQEQGTFEAMFNALPAAAVFTDLHGEIRLVNPAFTTLFGCPPQDVIGKPIDLLYVCMADDQAAGRFQPHAHTGDIATPVDVRYHINDGGTFIGETVVTAVKNSEDRVLGWLRLIRDITDRKHADALVEADLARLAKKHRYESIVSAVAHSVHQSTSLQAVLENAVEAMRTHIERIDAIEIFLREGEDAEGPYRSPGLGDRTDPTAALPTRIHLEGHARRQAEILRRCRPGRVYPPRRQSLWHQELCLDAD